MFILDCSLLKSEFVVVSEVKNRKERKIEKIYDYNEPKSCFFFHLDHVAANITCKTPICSLCENKLPSVQSVRQKRANDY